MASTFPGTSFGGNNKDVYTDGGVDAQFLLEVDMDNIDDELIAIQDTLHKSGNVRRFFNNTGSSLAAGDLVQVDNYNVANSLPTAVKADADAFGTAAGYVVIVAALNQAVGVMAKAANVNTLDTSTFSTGDEVYLSSTAGAFTATAPGAGKVNQYVGRVTKIDASSGEIEFAIDRSPVPDDSSLEHTTNEQLQIKALGVSTAKIAALAVTRTKLELTQQEYRVRKTADEAKTTDAMVGTDAALFITSLAAGEYSFKIVFFVTQASNVAGLDVQLGLGGTVTTSIFKLTETGINNDSYAGDGNNEAHAVHNTTYSFTALPTGNYVFTMEGYIETSTAGAFNLNWSQNVSDGNATTIKNGSYLEVRPLA